MLTATNSPTLLAHKLIQENISTIKGRLETARVEAVTGRAADVARHVNGDTAKVNLLAEDIGYAEDRISVLGFESSRMASAQEAMNAMRSLSSETLSSLRLLEPSPISPGKLLAEEAALTGLTDVVSRLNTAYGGRPLFGGDSGQLPLSSANEIIEEVRTLILTADFDFGTDNVLDQIEDWFNDPSGGFETLVYRGGDGKAPMAELSKGERVETSVRADDQAMRDLMRGFAIIGLAGETDDDISRGIFQEAGAALIAKAEEDIIQLQSSLGVREERVANAMAKHQGEVTTLTIAYNSLTGVDQAEAATDMRLLESQLEAAYLTTTRMANLSLTNYLR